MDNDFDDEKLDGFETEDKKLHEKQSLDKNKLIKAGGGFIGGAVLLLALVWYVKHDSNPNSEVNSELNVASPTDVESVEDLTFGKNEEFLPKIEQKIEPPPMPQNYSVQENNKEDLMKEARYKSSVVVTADNSGNSPSANNDNSLPPELQALMGASAITSNSSNSFDSNISSQGGRFNSGTQQAPISHASYLQDRRFIIQQGKIIDAILIPTIKSDIPSVVIAKTTKPVYGEVGRYQLIPTGTRLFGEYSDNINEVQTEVPIIWRRAITPQGVEIMLDSPATNKMGQVGVSGEINNHYFKRFSSAVLMSLLGAANYKVNDNTRNNSKDEFRTRVSESFNKIAREKLSQEKLRKTITVKEATKIKVIVVKDLDFSNLLSGNY